MILFILLIKNTAFTNICYKSDITNYTVYNNRFYAMYCIYKLIFTGENHSFINIYDNYYKELGNIQNQTSYLECTHMIVTDRLKYYNFDVTEKELYDSFMNKMNRCFKKNSAELLKQDTKLVKIQHEIYKKKSRYFKENIVNFNIKTYVTVIMSKEYINKPFFVKLIQLVDRIAEGLYYTNDVERYCRYFKNSDLIIFQLNKGSFESFYNVYNIEPALDINILFNFDIIGIYFQTFLSAYNEFCTFISFYQKNEILSNLKKLLQKVNFGYLYSIHILFIMTDQMVKDYDNGNKFNTLHRLLNTRKIYIFKENSSQINTLIDAFLYFIFLDAEDVKNECKKHIQISIEKGYNLLNDILGLYKPQQDIYIYRIYNVE